ncbi:MAG: hypothetical protein J7L34_06410 [Thermotogaceae bacterium]|nr:hypothetical protein [Thermotogaceae bacterium]
MTKKTIENFPPSWFACTMGTGILSIVSHLYSKELPFLDYFSKALFWFNVVFFFFLLVPWILRWILYPKNAVADLYHPINSNFYPTLGIGMLVIAAGFIAIYGDIAAAKPFWFVGVLITVFFSVFTLFNAFKGSDVKLHHINPAWFIPPVGLIVIPIAGATIAASYTGVSRDVLLSFNLLSWGAGFFLYLALHAVAMYRLILHDPLPGDLIPTLWINLGPVGAGSTSLVNIAKVVSPSLVKIFTVFASFLWGLGIWWLAVAIAMTVYYIVKRKFSYALSWWAFTFPLGAFISSSYAIGNGLGLMTIYEVGFCLLWLLMVFWVVTFIRSLKTLFVS